MASREPFLPVPTEEDPERMGFAVPTAANYSPPKNAAATASINSNFDGSTFAGSMSFDATSDEEGFANSADHHLLCFNSCCDFRRAVIIVNGISIGFKLLMMMSVAIMGYYAEKNSGDIENDIDDPEMREQFDSFVKAGGIRILETILEIIGTLSIGLHLCGIYGALSFKKWGILVAGSTYAFALFAAVINFDFLNIVMTGMFLYPHVFMYKLMEAEIMTEYNYHKIANCCGDRRL